jgi:hypothetical protein
MSQPEARAWWADVEDLRERIELRREVEHRTPDPVATPPRPAGPRRTVQITGRPAAAPAPRPLVAARQRPTRAMDAATRRPDRIAGWAALLGLVLVLVSTATH